MQCVHCTFVRSETKSNVLIVSLSEVKPSAICYCTFVRGETTKSNVFIVRLSEVKPSPMCSLYVCQR